MKNSKTWVLTLVMGVMCLIISSCNAQNKSEKEQVNIKANHVNIPYKAGTENSLLMDIYLPEKKLFDDFPVIIFVHGGSWYKGKKEVILNDYKGKVLAALLEKGYAVASINYTLAAEGTNMSMAIADCKDAVRWVRTHASEYGFDSERIAFWGGSAGSQLSMMAAYTSEEQYKGDKELAATSAKINLVVNNFGPANLVSLLMLDEPEKIKLARTASPKQYKKLMGIIRFITDKNPQKELEAIKGIANNYSPVKYVGADCPPTLIMHGNADSTVPIEQSEELMAKFKKANIECEYHIYKDVKHGFNGATDEQEENIVNEIIAFVEKHI